MPPRVGIDQRCAGVTRLCRSQLRLGHQEVGRRFRPSLEFFRLFRRLLGPLCIWEKNQSHIVSCLHQMRSLEPCDNKRVDLVAAGSWYPVALVALLLLHEL